MRRLFYVSLLTLALVSQTAGVLAQTAAQYQEQAAALLKQAQTQIAFDHVERNRETILREWTTLTEINAPSGQEKERAAAIEKLLRKYKLTNVHYDAAGNLIALRKGTGGGPTIVFDAHMDTVFQPGLKIKVSMRDGRLFAPGIGDDTRNIEALLASIRALNAAKIKTKGDLIFLFTVSEEPGLDGAKFFIKENKGKFDHYVALDGGYEGFTYGAIGINWYRHHFIGPGGHTLTSAPPFSATLPVARAISRIYELSIPENSTSRLNIGMLGGSEVVNAKAADAWFTLDLRSTNNEIIADLERKIAVILKEEAERAGMTLKTDIISASPAAQIPGHRNSYLVLLTEAVHRAMGFDPPITPTGSNNSSAALRAGISAISTGAGPCTNSHALTENCEIEPFYKGIKKIILLELALAQLS
jgi:tripeptide aminopeptidase